MKLSHKFDLSKGHKRVCKGGSRTLMTPKKCPALHNMAIALLSLKKGGFREPHWHPNADELTYCEEGKALITVFSPGNIQETFTLSKGEVVFFPKGYIHHIENIHQGESRFILAYDHDSPEDLDLSQSIGCMSSYVLASTFGTKTEVFDKVKKKSKDSFIGQKTTHSKLVLSSIPNTHKLNLEKINPQIDTPGGCARIANDKNLSLLKNLALFSLRIYKNGVREPHWHPNATELNYVLKGKARLTILSPGGKVDNFTLSEGQGSIIPAGYFHHIENIGKEELRMTVFFNNCQPNDLGLSGALSAYSDEMLASLFSVEPKFFTKIQKFPEDRMIVSGGG
jgi:oxalate decarboxylase